MHSDKTQTGPIVQRREKQQQQKKPNWHADQIFAIKCDLSHGALH